VLTLWKTGLFGWESLENGGKVDPSGGLMGGLLASSNRNQAGAARGFPQSDR
jgi:hypothetical protein